MIYLDYSATSNKKPLSVKLAVFKALTKKYCANPGRSSHKPSLKSGNEVFKARENINEFFNNDDVNRVIFTGSCTEALNTAIFGLIKENDHVIITSNEHNSVARPMFFLEKSKNISVTIVEADEVEHIVSAKAIEDAILPNTRMVVVNHTSNVTGATCNLFEIGKVCNAKKIILVVDGAQSAGHKKIDMIKDNVDVLALAGHKGLFAMQGVGVLVFRKHIDIMPLKHGGTGTYSESLTPPVSYPESLEAGTSPTPNIFSLNAGLKYVKKHFKKINSKIAVLTKYLLNELSVIKQIKLYTHKNCLNGVVSFNVLQIPCSDVVGFLNSNNIFTRGGFHCAPLVHKHLKTLEIGGTVRISLSHFNTFSQIKKVVSLLKQFCANHQV